METLLTDLKQQRASISNNFGIPPCVLTLTNFSQWKRKPKSAGKPDWASPPMYTHPGGYKFIVDVEAQGHNDGEDNHVSVYLWSLRGEFD